MSFPIKHGLTDYLYNIGYYHENQTIKKLIPQIVRIPETQRGKVEHTYQNMNGVEPSYEMEDVFFQSDMKIEIEEMFEILTLREREVLKHYFGLDGYEPKTLKEISFDVFDLSAGAAQMIKNRALRKLKKEFSKSA